MSRVAKVRTARPNLMAYADDRGTLERLEDAVLRRGNLSGRATWFAGIAAQAPERHTVRILRGN